MKLYRFLSAFCCALFFQASALAATAGMASDALVTTFACRWTYTGECKVQFTPDFSGRDMGGKVRIASQVVTDTLISRHTIAYANATFSDSRLLPVLRASATDLGANPDLPNPDPAQYTGKTATISDANVWAVGRYRYGGAQPMQLSFTATGHTEFRPVNPLIAHSHMRIGLFTGGDYRFDVDGICPIGGFFGCQTNTTTLATLATYLDPRNSLNELTIYYTVKPGDEFYVGAMLDANVCCGATVDSAHTMDMLFSDTSLLEVLPVPGAPISNVPEVKSYLLILCGLLLLGAVRFCKCGMFAHADKKVLICNFHRYVHAGSGGSFGKASVLA